MSWAYEQAERARRHRIEHGPVYAQQLLPFGTPPAVAPVPIERLFLVLFRASHGGSSWRWASWARQAADDARKARRSGDVEAARAATRRCMIRRALAVLASLRETVNRAEAQADAATSR